MIYRGPDSVIFVLSAALQRITDSQADEERVLA